MILGYHGVASCPRSEDQFALQLAPERLLFRSRVLDLPESHHYHHWIEMMPAGCMEVGFKADPDAANVRRAWEATERLVTA